MKSKIRIPLIQTTYPLPSPPSIPPKPSNFFHLPLLSLFHSSLGLPRQIVVPGPRIVPPSPHPRPLHDGGHLVGHGFAKHLSHPGQRRVDAGAHAAAAPHLAAALVGPHPPRPRHPLHGRPQRRRLAPGPLVGRGRQPVEDSRPRGEAGARAHGDQVAEVWEDGFQVGEGGLQAGDGGAGAEAWLVVS